MNQPRPVRLARRILLGAPALVAAAVAIAHGRGASPRGEASSSLWHRLALIARPAQAGRPAPECAADVHVADPEGAH